ncbi:formylglycine-generating enzyme family protein [Candidatus Hydrogenedentota bacterium]
MLYRLKSFRLFLILFVCLVALPLVGSDCIPSGPPVGEGEGEGEGKMISVPAGAFTMGRTDSGDDATYGGSPELPRHDVYLDSYQIGKYEVTNGEYTEILNWALDTGRLTDTSFDTWAYGQTLLRVSSDYCQISYSGGEFIVESRDGYSMADHPVLEVSWYGAAVYCNWLSESKGLEPCYDISTWECDFTKSGYHLPTEAQWERAAAWSGSKHWIYGYQSDTFSQTRANGYYNDFANPLGLSNWPYTSPVGHYNGTNSGTVDSPSPVGCYDMSGNVWEWCNDWYDASYYTSSPENNPTGPSSSPGSYRVLRGGSWYHGHYGHSRRDLRSARRHAFNAAGMGGDFGFRVSRD